jgi:catechol 2,3-dioxygenase-like lactoylglutathione lyase family enzyme
MSERQRTEPQTEVRTRARTEVELHVADLGRSLAFYEALGFRVARRYGEWLRLERQGAGLVLMADAYIRSHDHYFTPHLERSPRGVGVEIVVEVEDLEAARAMVDAAVAAGGGTARLVKDVTDRPWRARDFRLADPDGFFLRLTTPLAPDR